MGKPEYIQLLSIIDNYYKCKSDEYSSVTKGHVYSGAFIGEYVIEHPKDWQKVLPYPTAIEIIDAIENGINTKKVLKALKQWKKTL